MTRLLRRVLPTGPGGLAGLACALCCAIPLLLLLAGVVSGTGWAVFGQILPGVAVAVVTLATLAWWWAKRRPGARRRLFRRRRGALLLTWRRLRPAA